MLIVENREPSTASLREDWTDAMIEPDDSIDDHRIERTVADNNLSSTYIAEQAFSSTVPPARAGLKKSYIIVSLVLVILLASGIAFLLSTVERTISTQQEQSQTVPTTGVPVALQAQGEVVVSQMHLFQSRDNASQIGSSDVSSNNGTKITIDSFIATEGATLTVNAKASVGGQDGNIPANNIDEDVEIFEYSQFDTMHLLPGRAIGTAHIQNPSAFTGGMDAGKFKFVTEEDIDQAANSLSDQLIPSTRQNIQQQLQFGEQFIKDIRCSKIVNTDHQPYHDADFVTITVKVECSSIASKKRVYAL